jgi:c-di-GMP-binding flagellar brake protein YcgR
MALNLNELPLVKDQKVTITVRGEVFNVFVRGWRKGQYIVLDLPRVGVEDLKIAPQTGIKLHYTREGIFVNFETTSIHSLIQAVTLLVIEYPRKFDSHNLRKHERLKANFNIKYDYQLDGQKIQGSGIVRDISAGGILFTHTRKLEKENKLCLNYENSQFGNIQNQMVEIRNIRKNPKSETSPFVTGLKWCDISPETEASITKLVETRSADRRNEDR